MGGTDFRHAQPAATSAASNLSSCSVPAGKWSCVYLGTLYFQTDLFKVMIECERQVVLLSAVNSTYRYFCCYPKIVWEQKYPLNVFERTPLYDNLHLCFPPGFKRGFPQYWQGGYRQVSQKYLPSTIALCGIACNGSLKHLTHLGY